MPRNAHLSNAEFIRASLCEGLGAVLRRPSGPRPSVAQLGRLRTLLEALPLDSTAFAIAVNRLANARHYLETGEHGAARFELRLLRRNLEQ